MNHNKLINSKVDIIIGHITFIFICLQKHILSYILKTGTDIIV